jgi:phosphopantothenoylcysteine decarboxylase/phosphopantothenate--cysteine ligase
MPNNLKNKNIVLAVCGGIAVYKVCDLTRKLVALNANVTCVMTESAKQFVTPLTFQTLSGNKV